MVLLPQQAVQRTAPISSPWKLGHKISKGGFGTVYIGGEHQSQMAIKVTRDVSSVMGECLAEAARLRHENLLVVDKVVATRRGAFVRMALVDGSELFDLAGKISEHGMMTVLKGLLSATTYLHSRGLVHRDIKPENIVVSSDGKQVVLVDLGSLKKNGERALTQGTKMYQAPEAKGTRVQVVKTALDDWSVGATIATVATGRLINSVCACRESLTSQQLSRKPTSRCILINIMEMLVVDSSDRLSARRLNARLGEFLPRC